MNAPAKTPRTISETNPIGTDGFEFVEYTAPTAEGIEALRSLFLTLGFTETRRHRSKAVSLFQQENINFVLNAEPDSHAAEFAAKHGPSACAMAWRVADAKLAFEHAVEAGAKAVESQVGPGEVGIPAVEGIGGSLLYFVDHQVDGEGRTIYDIDFEPIPGTSASDNSAGLQVLDHLTHNVDRGQMNVWADFYTRLANFREIRYFDIEGKKTGLHSRAMTAPCGKMHIPINESADDTSQIAEFLREYNGEGIQHLAMATDDIYATVRALKANGITFMTTPDTYYEKVNARVPNHEENLEELRELNLLVDGGPEQGVLLQIFTETVIGPIFFEIIQRKGNDGFGEGNFKALFESIEEDQIRRGVLNDD
ncbi:4-hydroxyphenylpyruvate dioxygenase [Halomonas elongata]|uniref:4-hydroxyphenylpyruvate dioxygenase n=2 Tax=Halomonas elongata TaxID=2746 RepID=E1VB84_HALED|nr:4-hydroxyphenylpyruvate dioxygenase [Halomonas elongata]MBW5798834.1 4-hydroxyphenylpyruvate dioxygenase [Halomonas elongata]MDL4862758.1 4-hydroxyphenylpyruvate dioxygenase [Halomonas elongata]OBX36809.1 4-hydroxyphenylpyruvate dioxygenase [Halomonas elongata]RAW08705.1 4-hydroxyphenylpyruvate dioxygenase [Halomonas elongata]WBF19413.1 4-hydroxyphenylpyruvate dioxygenase [Halomonas elongata]